MVRSISYSKIVIYSGVDRKPRITNDNRGREKIMLRQTVAGAFLFAFSITPGLCGDTATFLGDVDSAFSHYREAASYLRTGNVDLAAVELDEMAAKWSALATARKGNPPDGFDGNPLFDTTLEETGKAVDEALALIDNGDPAGAEERLMPLRQSMSRFRAASQIYTLADCLTDTSAAMNELIAYRGNPPAADDWSARADVLSKAAVFNAVVRRCDAMASPELRAEPEFRRLFDTATQSSARIPEAIMTKDDGLLYRLLIELRSLDRLMFYRFG